jgi:hypothetical protein
VDALAGSTLAIAPLVIDGHLLARGAHVIAATLLVGGGVLAWAAWLGVRSGAEGSRAALRMAIRYEWLTLVGLLLAFPGGELGNDLDGLSTGVGLGLYALLWAASLLGTAGALQRIGHDIGVSTDRVVGAGALWGGVAGSAFLIVGLLALALYSAADGVAEGTVGAADRGRGKCHRWGVRVRRRGDGRSATRARRRCAAHGGARGRRRAGGAVVASVGSRCPARGGCDTMGAQGQAMRR